MREAHISRILKAAAKGVSGKGREVPLSRDPEYDIDTAIRQFDRHTPHFLSWKYIYIYLYNSIPSISFNSAAQQAGRRLVLYT